MEYTSIELRLIGTAGRLEQGITKLFESERGSWVSPLRLQRHPADSHAVSQRDPSGALLGF